MTSRRPDRGACGPAAIAMLAGLVAGVLSSAPAAAHAQAAAAASRVDPTMRPVEHVYLYLRGSDTVATETVSHTISAISGTMSAKASGRIEWRHEFLAPREYTSLAVRFFAPGADAPQQSATMRVRGDSAVVDVSAGSQRARQAVPTKAGAIALVNASVLHAAVLGIRALAAGQNTLDFFLSSGGQTVPGVVLRRGDTIAVSIAGTEMHVFMGSDGLPREILVPAQHVRVIIGTPPDAAEPATPVRSDALRGDHPFAPADPSGVPTGYAMLKDHHIRKDVLGALADWAVKTLRYRIDARRSVLLGSVPGLSRVCPRRHSRSIPIRRAVALA